MHTYIGIINKLICIDTRLPFMVLWWEREECILWCNTQMGQTGCAILTYIHLKIVQSKQKNLFWSFTLTLNRNICETMVNNKLALEFLAIEENPILIHSSKFKWDVSMAHTIIYVGFYSVIVRWWSNNVCLHRQTLLSFNFTYGFSI